MDLEVWVKEEMCCECGIILSFDDCYCVEVGDVIDFVSVEWFVWVVVSRFGSVMGLVYIVGVSGRKYGDGLFDEFSEDGW